MTIKQALEISVPLSYLGPEEGGRCILADAGYVIQKPGYTIGQC